MLTAPCSGETPAILPDHYVIQVKEHLSPQWSAWFEGLSIAYTDSGETLLSGPISDQAALHGFLGRIRDLNLTLILVNRVGFERQTSANFENQSFDENMEALR